MEECNLNDLYIYEDQFSTQGQYPFFYKVILGSKAALRCPELTRNAIKYMFLVTVNSSLEVNQIGLQLFCIKHSNREVAHSWQ